MTRPFLSTLSLSAEQNWAQNSGAKRRDDINSLIMGLPARGEFPLWSLLAILMARRPARFRIAAFVEQQIQRARIGGQISPKQPAWLQPNSPGPFQTHILHPLRRAGPAAGQEIEQAAGCLDDADIRQIRSEFRDKGLLVRH